MINKYETKMYWMGEDIETLSREKLIEIIVTQHKMLESQHKAVVSMIEINRAVDAAKRRRL